MNFTLQKRSEFRVNFTLNLRVIHVKLFSREAQFNWRVHWQVESNPNKTVNVNFTRLDKSQ